MFCLLYSCILNTQVYILSTIDMIFLTKTRLSEKHFDQEILPQDENVFRVDRKCRTGMTEYS